jgi:fibronectin-binding autotransporter adhesin
MAAIGGTGDITFSNANTGEATYSGSITLNGDLSIYSEVSNAKGLDFTGVISGTGSITHASGSAATATEIVKLSAANTFFGNTNLESPAKGTQSTLLLANSNALQNSTLNYTGTSKLAFASTVTSHAFTFGGLIGTSGIALQDNAISPVVIALSVGNNNSNTTYGGELSGGGSQTKVGTGTLTLTGAFWDTDKTWNNVFSGGCHHRPGRDFQQLWR